MAERADAYGSSELKGEAKSAAPRESKDESTDTTKPPDGQPKIQLYYFDMNGVGEPIRMALEYSGMQWFDYRFTHQQQFHDLSKAGHLMFGEVPVLQLDDDETKFVAQTVTILRLVGQLSNKYGQQEIYPKDFYKAALVDAVMEYEAEVFAGLKVSKYMDEHGFNSEKIPLEARDDIEIEQNKRVIPKKLKYLEQVLLKSKTPWLAGTKGPSIADFYWASIFSRIAEEAWTGDRDVLNGFPELQRLRADVYKLPRPSAGIMVNEVEPQY